MSEWFAIIQAYLVDILHLNSIGPQWYWWMLSMVMIATDCLLRTLFLFMIGLGLFIGGIAAAKGVNVLGQQGIAAIVASLGFFLVYYYKARAPKAEGAQRNTSVQNDVGNIVTVQAWELKNDVYIAKVKYRASLWSAQLDKHNLSTEALKQEPNIGEYEIVGMEATSLLLKAKASTIK